MAMRILLADDNLIVRRRVRDLLEQQGFEVIGEASNGLEAVRLARVSQPDIAILDLSMPLLNGLAAAREIHQDSPQTRTIMLTFHSEKSYVLGALRAGVRGYVSKPHAADDLVVAIQEVAHGETYLSPTIMETLVQAPPSKPEAAPYTPSLPEREGFIRHSLIQR